MGFDPRYGPCGNETFVVQQSRGATRIARIQDHPNLSDLRQLRYVDGLKDGLIEAVAAIAQTVSFSAEAILFREGTQNKSLYLISSGRVSLEMNVPHRGRVPILTVGPGESSRGRPFSPPDAR